MFGPDSSDEEGGCQVLADVVPPAAASGHVTIDGAASSRATVVTGELGPSLETSVGAALSRAEARSRSPSSKAIDRTLWHEWLQERIRPRREGLGVQRRPLILESMFTGMNASAFVLQVGGLAYEDRVGAEKKSYAHTFMQDNGIAPARCFEKAEDLAASDVCGSATSPADLFVAGFPCQPYSSQARKVANPVAHPLFRSMDLMIGYIRSSAPRVVILENTVGFQNVADFAGTMCTGVDYLVARLGDMYSIEHKTMNLRVWLDVNRPRLWIWLVRRRVGTDADLRAKVVGKLAVDIESSRPVHLRASVHDFMIKSGSAEWREKVAMPLQCRGGAASSRAVAVATAGERAAQALTAKALALRAARGSAPIGGDSCPVECAKALRMWGFQGSARQRAIVEALLATRCCHLGITDPSLARKGLFWDMSQNACEDLIDQPTKLENLACMVRSSLPYSFEADRLVLPEEVLRSHGWQIGDRRPVCSSLKDYEVQDLAGEMQAIQTLSVVMWAAILSEGAHMDGLFAGPSQP